MADDLTHIQGITPKIAQHMKEVGITTFVQLASKTTKEIAELLGPKKGIAASQIAKQNGMRQASQLAAKQTTGVPRSGAEEGANEFPNVVRYVLELSLDKNHHVTQTVVVDLKSSEKKGWQFWDEDRLLEFFASRPELDLPARKSVPLAATVLPIEELPAPPPEAAVTSIEEPPASPPATAATNDKPTSRISQAVLSSGQLAIVLEGAALPSGVLGHKQSCKIHLHLALTNVSTSQQPLGYEVVVMAKSIPSKQKVLLGEAAGVADFGKNVTLNVPGVCPPPGLYRTQALVTVFDSAAQGKNVVLRSLVEGSVLQVY